MVKDCFEIVIDTGNLLGSKEETLNHRIQITKLLDACNDTQQPSIYIQLEWGNIYKEESTERWRISYISVNKMAEVMQTLLENEVIKSFDGVLSVCQYYKNTEWDLETFQEMINLANS